MSNCAQLVNEDALVVGGTAMKGIVSRVRIFACLFLVPIVLALASVVGARASASLASPGLPATPAASAGPTTFNSGACDDYTVPDGVTVLQVDVVGDGGDHGQDATGGTGGNGGDGAHITALIAATPGTVYGVMVGSNDAIGIGNHGTGGGAVFAGGASGINSDPNCASSGWQIMAGGGGSGSDAIVGNDGVSGGDGCQTIEFLSAPPFPCPQASNGSNNHLVKPSGAGGAGGNGSATAGGSGGGGGSSPGLTGGNGGGAGTFLNGGDGGQSNALFGGTGGYGGGGYYGGGGGGGGATGATGGGGGGGSSVIFTPTLTAPEIYPASNGETSASSIATFGSVTFTPITASVQTGNLTATAGSAAAAIPVSATVSTNSAAFGTIGTSVRFDLVDPSGTVVATAGPFGTDSSGTASGTLDASAVPAGVYSIVATTLYGSTAAGSGSGVFYLTNPGVSVGSITSAQYDQLTQPTLTIPPPPGSQGTTTVQASMSGGPVTVTAASYSADPEATGLEGADSFFDVHLSGTSGVDSIDITSCGGSQFTINWWNGTAWVPVQPQYDISNTCAFIQLTSTSTPTLAQLTGTPFGVGPTQTTVSGVAAPTVAYDHTTTLTATVTPANGLSPVPVAGLDGTVDFTTGGTDLGSVPVSTAAGASSVTASLTVKAAPPDVPSGGQYPVIATFTPSGTQYLGSASAPATWTVTQSADTLTYTGAVALGHGLGATLSAVLKEDGVLPVAGRTVVFTVGSQQCSGVTNAAGIAQCTITVAAGQPFGPGQVTASFAGDADYLGSSTTVPTVVFSFPAGGAFVIGDVSAGPLSSQTVASGPAVTFWGAQWAKVNVLSGGPAPSAFKGFAPGKTAAACGTTWLSGDGGSTSPPAAPLPPYMGVIVASSIGKSGSTTSGNTVHIVVVKTSAGYSPDPSTPGTGSIVATGC
jgi:Bacterial Ig-like domain (group 3)